MSDREIEELQRDLEQLKIDFNRKAERITTRLAEIRRRSVDQSARNDADNTEGFFDSTAEVDAEPPKSNKLKIGDYAKIINDYRFNEKGIVGKVEKFNRPGTRVWIKDEKGEIYIRAPQNLRKVSRV